MFSESEPSDLLSGLDDDQRLAAELLHGPVCILAGAGSGKTRTISHRIAYGIELGVFNPSRILALTYTNRAASELRQRLRSLSAGSVQVRTFHSAALSQLQFFWPQLTQTLAPKLLTNKAQLLRDVLLELRIQVADDDVRAIASEIEWMKYSLTNPGRYQELERELVAGLSPGRFIEVSNAYESQKQQRRLADWEDVLVLTTGLLRSDQRMLNHVQQQYRHFTVDEYQDISPLQQALLETWLGDRQDLCVVGDPRQTIYSFAGADPSYLTGFSDRFPQAEVVELTKNYRSSVEIVALANKVSTHGELHAVRNLSSRPVVLQPSSAAAEAKQVGERISTQLENGVSPDEIAVLTRINSQLELIEKDLNSRGIATQVRGAGRFYRKPEVLKALTAIRALQAGALTEPLFAALSNILAQLGWVSRGGQGELWANLNWFMEIFDELGEPSLEEYLRELQERERSGDEPVRQAVTLATVHATKGLEWPSVYLCGLSQGLFPISYAKSDSALAEERRLFYVAVTRAKDILVLSSPADKPASEFVSFASVGSRS